MVLVSSRETQLANNTAASIAHSQEILYQTTKILSTITDNETGSRGFILTGNPAFLEPLINAKSTIHQHIDALKELSYNDTGRQPFIDSLMFYAHTRIRFSDSTVALRKEAGLTAAIALVSSGRGKFYVDNMRRIIKQMQADENKLLYQRKKDIGSQLKTEQLIFCAIAFIVLGLIIVLFWREKQRIEQKEHKKTHEQLTLLFKQIDQSNDSIYTTDANQKIKSWNRGAEKLYGFAKEEMMGKDPNIILKTVMTPEEKEAALKEVAKHQYWSSELRRTTKTHKDIWVRSSLSTIRDDYGEITRYVAVSVDITGQKKLREEANHLANLVEQSSEAIFSRGLDQRIISWNSGAENLFGYSKVEAIGKTATELGFVKPIDDDIAAIQGQIAEKGNWKAEMNYYHKDGSSFFGAVTGNCIKNEKGENTSFYFIVEDISLRRQLEEQLQQSNEALEEKVKARTEEIYKSEKHFRALIENNNGLINVVDQAGKIIYRSPSAYRITGFTNEEIINAEGYVNIHPDDREKANEVIRETLANPGKPIYALFRNLHKSGHYIWLEGVVTNLLHDENVKGFVANYHDATERIEAEEEIKNLNAALEEKIVVRTEQLRKTNEDLEAFSYSVSHDLRAPLRAIVGYTAILEEDYSSKLDDEAKRITTVIKSNTVRMGNLIDDLLAFSKMGRHQLVKTIVDTSQLINEICTGIDKKESKEKDIKWVIHPLPNVLADINTIRQVWINLISNAVKYSDKVEVPVIEIGSFSQKGQTVFFIKDNGAGFDEKYKNKLFKVFQRLHGAKEFEGTGIGLAIVEKVISKHGGNVWAEGEVNKGASFYFSLPHNKYIDLTLIKTN